MKVYLWKKNKIKWVKKVDWVKIILTFILIFVLCFIFFNFYIGGIGMLSNAVITSVLVAFFASLWIVLSQVIENRVNVFVYKDNKWFVIYPHNYGMNYDDGLVTHKEFFKMINNEKVIIDIIENVDKYTGIDLVKIKKIKNVRKYRNGILFVADAFLNEWHGKGGIFTISDYILKKRNSKKKFFIPNDYNNFSEIVDIISKN